MFNSSTDQYSQAGRKITVTQRCTGIDGTAHLPTALHPGLPKPHFLSIRDASKALGLPPLPQTAEAAMAQLNQLFFVTLL